MILWRLILLVLIQSIALSSGQLTMKIALDRMPHFSWSVAFWRDLLTNWWFLLCGILFGVSSILWMYILKHYPLSVAYPMASVSYNITILMAIFFLHEEVSALRWVGIALITLGCIFVAGK